MKFGDWKLSKYLVAGVINTGLTYLLYLVLVRFIPYIWAYSLTFAVGIILGYLLNALWVFKAQLQWRTMVSYPLAYVVNYALGMGLLWGLVEKVSVPKEVAPILVVVLSVPLMYVLTKIIFTGGKKNDRKAKHQ